MPVNNIQKKLTAFVVDDESESLQVLVDDLRRSAEISEVYAFSSYAEATLPLLELQPDVLFLDVEMPGKSGLDFLDSIRPRISFAFHVVFYTGYGHYMLDAIRHSASDFLLKPYKEEELRTVLTRLSQLPLTFSAAGVPAAITDSSRRKVAVQTVSELLLLSVEQILMARYIRAQRTWLLTLTDGSSYRLRVGMSADELLALNTSLVQINSGSIVNLIYLTAVENTTHRCRFCPPYEDIELFASRRFYSKLRERFDLL